MSRGWSIPSAFKWMSRMGSEEFFYSFHIATVEDKEVYQHMLGTIQIPLNHGTFYPYGPAV